MRKILTATPIKTQLENRANKKLVAETRRRMRAPKRKRLSHADVCEAESATAAASVATDDRQPARACVPVCSLSGDEEEEELEHSSIAVEDFVVLP